MAQLTEEQAAEYKDEFAVFDKNGTGRITKNELGMVMESFGLHATEFVLNDMIDKADVNGDGEIDFEEFCTLMHKLSMHEAQSENIFCEAFKLLDKDGDGYINVNDLQVTMLKLGKRLSDEQINEMLRIADSTGDGLISYEEFVAMGRR